MSSSHYFYVKKSVNGLSRIIYNTQDKCPTMKMSDLCDDLYKQHPLVDPTSKTITQNEANQPNKRINNVDDNSKEVPKKGKKSIIRLKIDVCGLKSKETGVENEALLKISDTEKWVVKLNDKENFQKTEHFKIKSNTTYVIELTENEDNHPQLNSKEDRRLETTMIVQEDMLHKNNHQDEDILSNNKNGSCNQKSELLLCDHLENLSTTLPKEDAQEENLVNSNLAKEILESQSKVHVEVDEKATDMEESVHTDPYFTDSEEKIKGNETDDELLKKSNSLDQNFITNALESTNLPKPPKNQPTNYLIEKANIEALTETSSEPQNTKEHYKPDDHPKTNTENKFKEKFTADTRNTKNDDATWKDIIWYSPILLSKNNEITTDTDNEKDSMIVTEIVMSQYGEILDSYLRKSLQRRRGKKWLSMCDEEKTEELKQTLERPNSLGIKNSSSQDLFNKTPDSGLHGSEDLFFDSSKSSQSFKSSDDTLKYSPTAFLREALGEEYMNLTSDSQHQQEYSENHYNTPVEEVQKQYSKDKSVGSSEISTLISTVDGVDSLYSTVDRSKKRRPTAVKKTRVVRPLFNTTPDEYIYESVDLNPNSKHEELNNSISVQCAVIVQLLRALDFCRQSPIFFGSIPHLEAEKYVLLETHKKEILENQLNKEYEEMEPDQCYGTVNIENLVFSATDTSKVDVHRYYLCLVQCNVTVLASDVVQPRSNGVIAFETSFQFDNLLSDFEIVVKLFCMTLENSPNKGESCLSPKKLCSPWKNKKVPHRETLPEKSAFRLLGTSKLRISDIYKKKTFTLEKALPNESISTVFDADILSTVNITNKVRGFLTIATTNILWNRRWCSLEGRFLKYWNYPDEESDKEPIGIFNLSDCVIRQVTNVDKALCSRPRTFMLEMQLKSGNLKQYFFQADNITEFEEWKRQLNSVLIALNNWKCLKY